VHAKERAGSGTVALSFANTGRAGAVLHVYDLRHLGHLPRRYTVGAGHELGAEWDTRDDAGQYNLWVLGPNGFHRRFAGQLAPVDHRAPAPEIRLEYDLAREGLRLLLRNRGSAPCTFRLTANAYQQHTAPHSFNVPGKEHREHFLPLRHSASWYDFTVRVAGQDAYLRRFAGRMETGRHSLSDPEMGGRARGHWG
jgi:phospholipase C